MGSSYIDQLLTEQIKTLEKQNELLEKQNELFEKHIQLIEEQNGLFIDGVIALHDAIRQHTIISVSDEGHANRRRKLFGLDLD